MNDNIIEVKITCRELTELYVSAKQGLVVRSAWICQVLAENFGGADEYYRPKSLEVIQQFKCVLPNRFMKRRTSGSLITTQLLQKYVDVADPRLSLLKAIQPDHVFTFKLYWR